VRLDSKDGHTGWTTYHAERCAVLRGMVWVDQELKRWAQYVLPYRMKNGALAVEEFEAKKILILVDRKLIVINPVGLGDRWESRGDVLVTRERKAPAWTAKALRAQPAGCP
jgi:hypothetical protein